MVLTKKIQFENDSLLKVLEKRNRRFRGGELKSEERARVVHQLNSVP